MMFGKLTDRQFTALYEILHSAWNSVGYANPLERDMEELLFDMEDERPALVGVS